MKVLILASISTAIAGVIGAIVNGSPDILYVFLGALMGACFVFRASPPEARKE